MTTPARQRIHLRARTVAVLNALAAAGPGGHLASTLAASCGLPLQSATTRLSWLKRARIVAYASGRWRLLDVDLFRRANGAATTQHEEATP